MNATGSRDVANVRTGPWLIVAGFAVLLKLGLAAAQPIVAIGGAGHDDRLFLELANQLLLGHWLGDYSQFTLMKGPMYSLWIAAVYRAGVPLPISQHLLYLAGCMLVARALQPHLSVRAAVVVFLVLWWNPMSFELPVLGRVLRQNLYTPTALIYFAALIALSTRQTAATGVRVTWAVLLGTTAAMLWLTREEGVWLVPSTGLLLLGAAWSAQQTGGRLRPLVVSTLQAAGCAIALVGTVCAINYHHYGWFGTVEFRAPEFIHAYSALQRVKSISSFPYVSVSREAREKIYAVSPAFAELRPSLEGDKGLGWAAASSPWTRQPKAAGEIGGGWFMWALRDALIASGHGNSARLALDHYGRIASEVNAACDDGRLPAYPRSNSLMPYWKAEHTVRLQSALPMFVSYFATFRGFSALPTPSAGSAVALELFRDLTRWHLAVSPDAPEVTAVTPVWHGALRLRMLSALGSVAQVGGTAIVILGTGAWLACGVALLKSRRMTLTFLVATAALGAATAVVAINLLVHVTSFPNLSPGAFAQAYPLILLFGVLALREVGALWKARRTSRRDRSSAEIPAPPLGASAKFER